MDNHLNFPINPIAIYAEKVEKMYPDCYTRIYPHVQYMVNSMGEESMHNLTNDDVERISEEAMKRSNILNDPPVGHTEESIRDMTRALIVRDIHDRFRRHRPFPFFPFFFFPFDDFDRNRHNRQKGFDFDRDINRDRDHEWY